MSNNDIDLDYINSEIIVFFSDRMDLVTIDLNSFNPDAKIWIKLLLMILKLLFMLDLWIVLAWHNRFQQHKAYGKHK